MAEELLLVILQIKAGVEAEVKIFDAETGKLIMWGDLESCYHGVRYNPSWEITSITTDGIKELDIYVDTTYDPVDWAE